MKRVLLVSDSLGTPIHARGIFNFTCSIVQLMRSIGMHVTLLVEPPDLGMFGVAEKETKGVLQAGDRLAALADLFKHFRGERFRFDWNYRDDALQTFSLATPEVANFRLAMIDYRNACRQKEIPFAQGERAFFRCDEDNRHLLLFDGFLAHFSVYSESLRRANLSLKPVRVDAATFDYVYSDTPHYIEFDNIDKARVISVVHDFIPLYDTSMGFEWTHIFVKKMKVALAVSRRIVFNSETTRKEFHRIYGDWHWLREVVIYPPYRAEVASAARNTDRARPSNYIRAIEGNKRGEYREWLSAHQERTHYDAHGRSVSLPKSWQGKLPYFCSVLSDEARKNIQALVDVSKHFVGRANFVIMGKIDGNRYMQQQPGAFPNVHFTGYVSDIQKFDLLRATKAFVFPSRLEGFGIPIVEAALFGAPIICSDIEIFREITDGRASYFDLDEIGALRRCLEAALRDPRLSGVELGRSLSERYAQSAMAPRLTELFREEERA